MEKRRKKLYLITATFPFAQSEAGFLKTEAAVLNERFDLTVIARDDGAAAQTTELPQLRAVRLGNASTLRRKLMQTAAALFDRDFLRELPRIFSSERGLRLARLKACLVFVAQARQLERLLRAYVQDDSVLYSYWGDCGMLAIAKLKRKLRGCVCVCRMHGFDLYEERNEERYQPCKIACGSFLDAVLFVSEYGKNYYSERFSPDSQDRLHVAYIGSDDIGLAGGGGKTLRLLSCSSMIRLKRIDKIIDALSLLPKSECGIEWCHVGSGELASELEEYAAAKLSHRKDIVCSFCGELEHGEFLRFAQSLSPQLFINCSESEGLPITLCEAASMGIALIAPDVGGISEIVGGENGFLLGGQCAARDIADALIKYTEMKLPEKQALSARSRAVWERKFNAKENARELAMLLDAPADAARKSG